MRATALRMPDDSDRALTADLPPDDAWLMSRIAEGDVRAYEELVDRHLDRFTAFAERVTGQRAEAEDILQEAFLRLWTKAQSWRPAGAKFTTWFYRIVLNLSIDYKRRKRPDALPEGFDVADDSDDAERQLATGETQALVARALDDLPPRQKQAIALCYFEGLSNLEAADILGVGVKALESLLVRGRKQLADRLSVNKDLLMKDSWT